MSPISRPLAKSLLTCLQTLLECCSLQGEHRLQQLEKRSVVATAVITSKKERAVPVRWIELHRVMVSQGQAKRHA